MFLVIVQKQHQYVTCLGSEFQNIGPATEKARRPYVVSRWDGITSWWLAAERRCRLEAVVESTRRLSAQPLAQYSSVKSWGVTQQDV